MSHLALGPAVKSMSQLGRAGKAPVVYWVPKSVLVGINSLMLMLLIDVIRTGEFLMGTCEEFNVPVAICCLPALPPCCPGPCRCFLLPLPR